MFDFENCLGELKDRSKNVEINSINLMIVVKYAMEIIEITELKGVEQKEMVIKLVKTLVKETALNNDIKKVLDNIIDSGVLSVTIDLVVDASKGNLKINLKKKLKRFCYV